MDENSAAAAGHADEGSPSRKWVGCTIRDYRVVRLLGRGGMGEVLLAEDLRLNRKVAIKVLRAEYTQDVVRLRRFTQEAHAASALNHQNIVALYDIGDSEVGKFIVMEYVQGNTLRKACAGGIGLDRAAEWAAKIARALSATHAAGIVHRDIKPENVMVRDDGEIKVLDFGLARRNLVDSPVNATDSTIAPLTGAGQMLGTLPYMSPEQALIKTVTPAADIFSLGIVLYEMVTGTHPFAAKAQVSMLHAIISHEPIAPSKLIPDLSGWLESLILKMLSKDPAARPTAEEVAAELESGVHKPALPARSRFARTFVGRENELAMLHHAFQAADREGGKLICLAGEAGLGKTSLVEEFLSEVEMKDRNWLVGRGRCSERLAGSEAYLPFLEALDSMLRLDGDGLASRTLKALAPTWYQRMLRQASSVSEEYAVSQERLKREMVDFLQEFTKQQRLVLFFDDLHWADDSTVDMLGYIAGQFQSIRAILVVTYRPTEMALARHLFLPLKLDLVGRSVCREVNLDYLTISDIEKYLAKIFPGHQFPREFARLVHSRTGGNALFMTDLIQYLKDRGVIHQDQSGWIITDALTEVQREMPESIRSIVQRKIDQLQEKDRIVLVGASVQGFDFDSASLSKVLEMDPAELEEQLERLERVHAFVRLVEEREFPNHTVTVRYRFVHVLYQNALYASLRPTRKVQLSLAMAQTLLGLYGEQCSEVASNLAFLLETARDFVRAADYYILAARNALQIFANKEAAALSRHCLELLQMLPPSPSRTQREMAAQMTLGVALTTLKGGYSDPEVEAAYGRALELSESMGEDLKLFPALYGLWSVYLMRSDYSRALELGQKMLPIALRAQDRMSLTMSYNALGYLKPFIGDFTGAKNDLEEMIRWHNLEVQQTSFAQFGAEPKTGALPALAWTCWALGFADRARSYMQEAREMTRHVKHSVTVGGFMTWKAWLALDLEDFDAAKQTAEEALVHGRNNDLVQTIVYAQLCHGAALAALGETEKGIGEIRQAVALQNATGCTLAQTLMLLSITEALAASGDLDQAQEVLDAARDFQTRTNEQMRAPEFDRIAGNILLLRIGRNEFIQTSAEEAVLIEKAAAHFQSSIAIARSRHARSFELKTSIELARLRQRQGRLDEAAAVLKPIVDWFTEGFDTPLLVRGLALAKSL